jgi:hypothetical protein
MTQPTDVHARCQSFSVDVSSREVTITALERSTDTGVAQ